MNAMQAFVFPDQGSVWAINVLLSRRGSIFIATMALLLVSAMCVGTITLATELREESVALVDNLAEGLVIDPNGAPISAQVWIAGPPRTPDSTESPVPSQWITATMSDDRGRFQIPKSLLDQFPKSDSSDGLMVRIAATSPGWGFAWSDINIGQPNPDCKLRLAEDVKVYGRFVSTEGNPIRGVEVSIVKVTEATGLPDSATLLERGSTLSGVYTMWPTWMGGPPQSTPVVTDPEGSFTISGIGGQRWLHLQARGATMADARLSVVMQKPPPDLESGMIASGTGLESSVYFSEFTHVAASGRTLTGQVTDANSKVPIANVQMIAPTAWHSRMAPTFTDKTGRFQIDGVPQEKQYQLELTPSNGSGYFRKNMVVDDTLSEKELIVNPELIEGKLLRGRVVDAITGKGLAATIEYNALRPNSLADQFGDTAVANPLALTQTNEKGEFAIAVLAGLGAIGVRSEDKSYASVFLDPKKVEQHFRGVVLEARPDATGRYDSFPTAGGGRMRGTMSLRWSNAFELLNVDPSLAPEPLEISLVRAATRQGEIFDAEGEPLAGVEVLGLGPSPTSVTLAPLTTSTFSVLGLQPDESRTLVFLNQDRSLGATLVVKGSEEAPIRVTMRPTGSIIGKLEDSFGKPVRNLLMYELELIHDGGHLSISDFWEPEYQKDGTFRYDGLIPGLSYGVRVRTPNQRFGSTVLDRIEVTSGQTKDLSTFKLTEKGLWEAVADGSDANPAGETPDAEKSQ